MLELQLILKWRLMYFLLVLLMSLSLGCCAGEGDQGQRSQSPRFTLQA